MIIETFNTTYLAVMGCFILFGTVLCLFLKKQSKEFSRIFLLFLYSAVCIYYFVYKGFLLADEEYCIMENYQKPYFLNELPFNTCNVLLFMMPFALLFMNDALLSCTGFYSFVFAAMALLMPSDGFNGANLLTQRVIGYYITHYMVLLETFLLIGSGLYKPKYKDMFKATGTLFICAAGAFAISLILVKTGLCPQANYFYTMSPKSNPVLKILWKLVPIQGLYIIPAAVITCPYCAIVTFVSNLLRKEN